ncbi:MAG: hypothetical protein K2X87_25505 [Gemmataceae bacterium]|nr:hypothetical protein [Gemmataceae bacterium]
MTEIDTDAPAVTLTPPPERKTWARRVLDDHDFPFVAVATVSLGALVGLYSLRAWCACSGAER